MIQAPLFKVTLVEPEIPQNTGNIGRTCVGASAELHLVKPYGFEINDKNLKRAGLDYWPHLTWAEYDSIPDWDKKIADPSRVFYFSAKAKRSYYDVQYQPGDWFVFGKETKGLPDSLLRRNESQNLIIPLLGPVRGLNVATAVAIVLYEAVRQVKGTHPDLVSERAFDPNT
ncbi:MAG: tRNA (cytidine(34)-2'-O)-methyltransferase [Pseudobdellovibrionaceae bacterium]